MTQAFNAWRCTSVASIWWSLWLSLALYLKDHCALANARQVHFCLSRQSAATGHGTMNNEWREYALSLHGCMPVTEPIGWMTRLKSSHILSTAVWHQSTDDGCSCEAWHSVPYLSVHIGWHSLKSFRHLKCHKSGMFMITLYQCYEHVPTTPMWQLQ